MDKIFEESFEYKLIYVFTISDDIHKGLLKIGDATIQTDSPIDALPPNCHALNQAAKKRIDQYTKTAAISYQLLHTELAIRTVRGMDGKPEIKAFRDHHVHRVLINSGISKKDFGDSRGKEWFQLDIATALNAINAVKKRHPNLSQTDTIEQYSPIIFRPEQEIAIKQTLKQFETGNRMLWNAKMRFGKTLCALEVVKESGFAKTIIITHRPVVDEGWYTDFKNIFYGQGDYEYGSKKNGATVEYLLRSGKKFVYFASMQDLRGSSAVGGKFDKNDIVFSTDWDCVVVDEAHEGTTTSLGEDVIKNVVKETDDHKTKFLALSGTPFNILNEYENNIYTWDYVMEQQNKKKWDANHFGDSNPYDELPELRIYTYDLDKIISDKRYVELEDKAFNFREFFRVWTGDIRSDRYPVPAGCNLGDFYHANDVRSFLDLITKSDEESQYPYATEEYRALFKHSLWIVPGVREAKALSKMMKKHPVFGSGAFDIVNVAGDGDEEEKFEDALKKVRSAIGNAGDNYTITLSCGKLTTGVTVPEWTSVFMLAGSFSTSASNYLQTIFRVQSPCNKNGKIKRCCYVFDFAPDRTLKMVAEAVTLSTKAGKATDSDKRIMGEFLNYCPVIAVDGTVMKAYDTNRLLQQLKRAYAERAVKNGFDDTNLYNDELLKLDGVALEEFKKLKGIVGSSKAAPKTKDIDINNQGFTDEEYEEIERISKKPKTQRTPEEEARLKEISEKKKQKNDAISILRGISIRMPLLIYGADLHFDVDVTMDRLVELVDDSSWDEFMPAGVTKELFKSFIKYYDKEIFIAAGRRIRNTVKSADALPPTERIQKITNLFACFKNPDKETVLTPWRAVNMHMSDCFGGYNFYDIDHNQLIEVPRYVDHGKVTATTLSNKDARILEINSKTGLYPLYVTYSIFRSKCSTYAEEDLTFELQEQLWDQTVQQNVFVICKTPMAKSITRRTLVGYREITVNAHYFDDLINMMKNKPKQFLDRVLKPSYWKMKGEGAMKFDAVVGNPPYQLLTAGDDNGAQAKPIYQHFITQATEVSSHLVSMITPSRWFSGGWGLDDFRNKMITCNHISLIHDYQLSTDLFSGVQIKGGISYFLYDKEYNGECDFYSHPNANSVSFTHRYLHEKNCDVLIRYNQLVSVYHKIQAQEVFTAFSTIVSGRSPFAFNTNHHGSSEQKIGDIPYLEREGYTYMPRESITRNTDWIGKYKVYITKAYGAGEGFPHQIINKPILGEAGTICSGTYLVVGPFANMNEASNALGYMKTKFFRAMVLINKISQDAYAKVYNGVPMQDFSETWNDQELYTKYGLNEEEIAFIESMIKPMD